MTSKVFPQSNLPIRRTVDMLPAVFRTSVNKKFYAGTMDALTQPGTLEKSIGYVGRRYGKTFQNSDVYLNSQSKLRNAYQLEPGVTIRNGVAVESFYDYLDLKAQQQNYGSISARDDFAMALPQYSWNPPINWDMFVNYREYYWSDDLPADYIIADALGNSEWSLANKWVHRDDVQNIESFDFREIKRAKRPIICFNGLLELFPNQTKTHINQAPLFDVVDANGISFSDTSVYPASTFRGTKIFGYDIGNGPDDQVLGFPLRYQTVDNIGDIVFKWFFDQDRFTFLEGGQTVRQHIRTGFYVNNSEFENGWTAVNRETTGSVVDTKTPSMLTSSVTFNTVHDWASVEKFAVFKNGFKLSAAEIESFNNGTVEFANEVSPNDVITLKVISSAEPLDGFYEFPTALDKNPFNQELDTLTLGEATDHLRSAFEFEDNFSGIIPGNSNVRTFSSFIQNATRFIKHAGSAPLATALVCDSELSIVKSLRYASKSYSSFKNQFFQIAERLPFTDNVSEFVDNIISEYSKSKSSRNPFANSDMIGAGAFTETVIKIDDPGIVTFALTEKFDLDTVSQRAVYVYLNGEQLVHGKDYTFNSVFGFVQLSVTTQIDDVVTIKEYVSTGTNFIPPTPTSMGLYKKYIPEKYTDSTYSVPTEVICGHDGSITVAFGDYRDNLLIELERRIYNNIKIEYDDTFFCNDTVLGGFYQGEYSKSEVDAVVSREFLQWVQSVGMSFSENSFVDLQNPFTFNYSNSVEPTGQLLPGHWRGIYLWLFDTVRPHTHPWEMLGFSIKPDWWNTEYGLDYSSNNTTMWSDILQGVVRQGPRQGQNVRYVRTLAGQPAIIPVDANGNLQDPISAGIANKFSTISAGNSYKFGDVAPVEFAWRSSSEWPFAAMIALSVLKPFEFISKGFNKLAFTKNETGQTVSKQTNRFVSVNDLISVPGHASGLSAYVVDFVKSKGRDGTEVFERLSNLNVSLSTRMSGFVDTEKQQYVLDSKSPASSGVFVPKENYQIILHRSAPVQVLTYSGVIVEKTLNGWAIRGYDVADPYFDVYEPNRAMSTTTITVGGVSEEFVNWTENSSYLNGQLVQYRNDFYRSIRSHTSSSVFESSNWAKLAKLPVSGASEAVRYTKFKTDTVVRVPYGAEFSTLQQVIDVILGYAERLKELGFVFDGYDSENQVALDWITSCKELLFWSRQNWANGAMIALSPAATTVKFSSEQGSPESLIDNFDDYRVLDANSAAIPVESLNVDREFDNTIISTNDGTGIYFVKISITLTEHVAVFSDKTVFNDVIYDKATGFRQERIKSRGFKTVDWNGSYLTPGFIYDEAIVSDWQPFVDYKLGDMVRYRSQVYTSLVNQLARQDFEFANWEVVTDVPSPSLIPNFDYRIKQIEEYYDPAGETLSNDLRSHALHTFSFQDREYLNELAEDATTQLQVYQGFIRDKGTIQSISKVFGRLNRETTEPGIVVKEDWAFRVGRLGGIDQLKEIEFELNKAKLSNFQNIVFAQTAPLREISARYVVPRSAFTINPEPFSPDFIPVDAEPKLRVAGYVNVDDIALGVKNKQELLSKSTESLSSGDYIWTTFEGTSWGVYRFVRSDFVVIDLSVDNDLIEFELSRPSIFVPGDVIGIKSSSAFDTFYEVVESDSRVIKVKHNLEDVPEIVNGMRVFVLENSRYNTFESTDPLKIAKLPANSMLWLDSSANGWEIVKKQQFFKEKPQVLPAQINDVVQRLGFNVVISEAKNQLFVTANSSNTGVDIVSTNVPSVLVLEIVNSEAVVTQTINPDNNVETMFGSAMAVSPDGAMLVVASDDKVYTYQSDNIGTWTRIFTGNVVIAGAKSVSISGNGTDYVLAIATDANTAELYEFNTNTQDWSPITTVQDVTNNFASDVVISNDANLLVVSASDKTYRGRWSPTRTYKVDDVVIFDLEIYKAIVDTTEMPGTGSDWIVENEIDHIGEVFVYIRQGSSYDEIQRITASTIGQTSQGSDQFGFAIALSSDANTLVIGSPKVDNDFRDQGAVYVFEFDGSEFVYEQTLVTNELLLDENFGHSVSISSNSQTVSVGAKNTPTVVNIFEQEQTTFDNNSTFIVDYENFFGSVYVFDRKGSTYYLSEKLEPTINPLKPHESFGYSVACSNRVIIAGSPDYADEVGSIVKGKFRVFRRDNDSAWDTTVSQGPIVDLSKIQSVELLDNVENVKISEVDYIDPAKLKILNIADQEIAYKTVYDPAVYNTGDNAGFRTVDESTAWSESAVGMLWWDLSTVKWVYYEQSTDNYRSANWGKIAPGASIDVYEWVESELLPSEWNEAAQTPEGNAEGITGTPLHPEDDFYTVKMIKNSTGNQLVPKYFYWVKNVERTPLRHGRRIPASAVADAILRPETQRTAIVGFTGSRSIKAYNFNSLMPSATGLLNIQLVNHASQPVINSNLNAVHNEYQLVTEGDANSLPTLALENKWIDSLVGADIAGNVLPDITLPENRRYGISVRPRQSMFVNRFGAVRLFVEQTNEILRTEPFADFISLRNLGATDPAPVFDEINTVNSFEELQLIPQNDRGPDILVLNDETANGLWCVYFYNPLKEAYFRRSTQSFSTSRFWDYVDWWVSDVDSRALIFQEIATISEESLVRASVGDLIKVREFGSGGWGVFRKVSDEPGSFLEKYELVGRERGTIRISELLYQSDTLGIGYGVGGYDSFPYDFSVARDLRNIIRAVKEDICTGTRLVQWNLLFFASVRYVFSEQQFVDWAFKTSFITAIRNVGSLDQRLNYRNDALGAYEAFLHEAKPYRTTVRDYRSRYTVLDKTDTMTISDFDDATAPFELIRKLDLHLKFDRVSVNRRLFTKEISETFDYPTDLDNGAFVLLFSPTSDPLRRKVKVNGEELIIGEFEFTKRNVMQGSEVVTQHVLSISYPLTAGDIIEVDYDRNIEDAYAADRFLEYYQSTPGNPTILPQVFSGIDFGGVDLHGQKFEVEQEIRLTTPFAGEVYTLNTVPGNDVAVSVYFKKANSDIEFLLNDNIIVGDGNTNTIDLTGQLSGIDVNSLAIKYSLTNIIELEFETEAHADPAVSNGLLAYFYDKEAFMLKLNNEWVETINIGAGDELIFVYSAITESVPLDVIVQGPEYDYSDSENLINGIDPSVSVTGSTLNDPVYIPAPEENVPGQLLDTVSIKVFREQSPGAYYTFEIHKDNANHFRFNRFDFSTSEDRKRILVEDLVDGDDAIVLNSTDGLYEPVEISNFPGVVDINGERIEYFVKDSDGQTLRQLRRGAHGSPAKTQHNAGSFVVDVSVKEQLAYVENEKIKNFETEQTLLYSAKTTAATSSVSFAGRTVPGISSGNGTAADWFEVFVNGRRLKKNNFQEYNVPTGTVSTNPAEFTAEYDQGSGNTIVNFTSDVPANATIAIIGLFQVLPDGVGTKGDADFMMFETTEQFINQRLSVIDFSEINNT